MELQIQDLVASIKKEGLEAAEQEAEAILAQAREEAKTIVETAQKEAERTLEKAKNETAMMKESIRQSADHAQRDAMLSFRGQVQKELEKILTQRTAQAVQGEALVELIRAALQGEDPANYTVQTAAVTQDLKSGLAEKLQAGLELQAVPGVKAGFRLCAKDGSGYFDCTDDALSQMLAPFFPELHL